MFDGYEVTNWNYVCCNVEYVVDCIGSDIPCYDCGGYMHGVVACCDLVNGCSSFELGCWSSNEKSFGLWTSGGTIEGVEAVAASDCSAKSRNLSSHSSAYGLPHF